MNKFGVSSQPLTEEEEFQKMLEKEKPYLLPEAIKVEPEPELRSQKYASLIEEQMKFQQDKSRQFEKDNDWAEIYYQLGLDEDYSWMDRL